MFIEKERIQRPLAEKGQHNQRNGKTRPLEISTMKDEAMQVLYFMALEPIPESEADANSYGVRKFRSTADAQ